MRVKVHRSFRYAVAVLAVVLAVGSLFIPVVGRGFTSALILAVLVSAWHGGLGPGLVATALTVLSAVVLMVHYFQEPMPLWRIIGLVLFGISGILISILVEAMHAARRKGEVGRRLLEATLSSIGDAVLTTDAEGRVLFLNAPAEEITGWTQEEVQGRRLEDFFILLNESTREVVENPIRKVLETGLVMGLANHTVLIDKSGQERPIDDSAAPIRDDEGTVHGTILVFRDISERRKAEESTRFLAAIVDSSSDAIVSKSLDGTIGTWNAGAERLFGYTSDEAVGKSITMIIPPDRLSEEQAIIEKLCRGERVDHFETVRITKDGRLRDISLTISPIRDASDRIIGASKIARDITERKRTEEALREADRRKDEFLALLAHELRNPLAPMRNSIELMRLASDDVDEIAQAREILARQLEHMVRLIDDLLDVSRINLDKIELRRSLVPLAKVLDTAIEIARPLIKTQGHTLTVTPSSEPFWLNADLTRLAQVFGNLLANSAKYTDPGGHIGISAHREDDDVLITVVDNGIGIPASAIDGVFDMFSQVDRSLERSTGGLGIGLALVKGLVEMHHGTVTAESPGIGQGSRFTVRLPIATIEPDRSAPAAQNTKVETDSRLGRRILVVEDNPDSAMSMVALLQLLGHEVASASDGLEALDTAEEFRPEVILMDVGMPRLNGYDATRRIRERPWGAQVRIIALTGWGQQDDKTRAQKAGCDGHMVKPVNLADLKALLATLPTSPTPTPGDDDANGARDEIGIGRGRDQSGA